MHNHGLLVQEQGATTQAAAPHRWRGVADYVSIARPDHWFKNVFMLPGAALAISLGAPVDGGALLNLLTAVVSTCCIASANYTINEWLDAKFDRHHPLKRTRPSATGRIRPELVFLQWLGLAAAGLGLALSLSPHFLAASTALLAMGIAYNVQPLRTKDRPFLDALSESVNNPLRFILGWSALAPDQFPPSSALLAYWMGGAFLMTVKRYAEYRFIGDPERAGRYRQSFKFYTENSLLLSAFFYALMSAFFLGVFLVKYRIEFILTLPFFSVLFVWYLQIGLRVGSVSQTPEKLYKEGAFISFVLFLALLVAALFFVDMPWLDILVSYHALSS
ncbi:MAG TPA: UbiA family prenyltransferase [Alphaproteobacteria bacterium]|nr:UbiA family prenyltransferase [Alphaproteobacteria bacterium]